MALPTLQSYRSVEHELSGVSLFRRLAILRSVPRDIRFIELAFDSDKDEDQVAAYATSRYGWAAVA